VKNFLFDLVFFPVRAFQMNFGGGGGGGSNNGPQNYAGLERLYQEQADSAALLRGIAETNLPGSVTNYMSKVNDITAPGYAERKAGAVAADMTAASAAERDATSRELTSMGVNPNDPRFAGSLRSLEANNASRVAAGKNIARTDAENYQLNVAKDAVGTFTGQSNSAANQAGAASSGLSSMYNSQANIAMQQQQAEANRNNSNGQAIGTAAALTMFKDGGEVIEGECRHVPGIDMLAFGGTPGQNQGFFATQQVQPTYQGSSTPAAPSQPTANPVAMARVAKAVPSMADGTFGAKMSEKSAKISDAFGQSSNAQAQRNSAGDAYRAAAEKARASGDTAKATELTNKADTITGNMGPSADLANKGALDAATEKTGEVVAEKATEVMAEKTGEVVAEKAVEAGVTETAKTAVADAAVGTAAGAAGGSAALGAVATALPWVGAALAVGSMLGAFKDGGEVKTRELQDDGGAVKGPGGPTDDVIPALLSNGEFVVNAAAVKLVGKDKLEAINKAGLDKREGKKATPSSKHGLSALACGGSVKKR
jgi:hypothetical protein